MFDTWHPAAAPELVSWLVRCRHRCCRCRVLRRGATRSLSIDRVGRISTRLRSPNGWRSLAAESPAIFPEHVVAESTRVSLGQALEPFKRASTIEAFPCFGDALRNR